jgi:hypothetical protein
MLAVGSDQQTAWMLIPTSFFGLFANDKLFSNKQASFMQHRAMVLKLRLQIICAEGGGGGGGGMRGCGNHVEHIYCYG